MLCGHANPSVEELGGEIRSVRPRDGVDAGVQREETEVRKVPKRLKDGPFQFSGKVDLTLGPVAEAQPDDEVSDVAGLNQSWHTRLTSLSYMGERALRKTTPQNRTVLNPDGDLVVPVVRVKVRRVVILPPILLAPQEMLRITRD